MLVILGKLVGRAIVIKTTKAANRSGSRQQNVVKSSLDTRNRTAQAYSKLGKL